MVNFILDFLKSVRNVGRRTQSLFTSLLSDTTDSFTFVGTGDFDACKQQVESMFTKNCSHSTCGTLGAYQPELYGHFTVCILENVSHLGKIRGRVT